jgi:hypothetical protein
MKYKLLFKKKFYLYYYIISTWVYLACNLKLSPNSKYKYYAKNDADFLRPFNAYMNESLLAIAQMNEWLNVNNIQKPLFNRKYLDQSKNTLCVGIITKKRLDNRYYVVQTVASLLSRVKLNLDDRVSISLIDASRNRSHDDLIFIDNLIEKFHLPPQENYFLRRYGFKKFTESYDYAKIMEYFYKNKPECKYTLLLEDDSIAAYDWYHKIDEALNSLDKQEQWLCLKLFTSYRFFDFFTHIPTLILTFFVSFLASFIQVLVFLKLGLFKIRHFKTYEIYLIFLNTSGILILLKSVHTSPLGLGVIEFSIGFNTVANLYPRAILATLSDYFEKFLIEYIAQRNYGHFLAKDLLLKKFKDEINLKEYIVEPAVFQHVGLISSMSWRVQNKDLYKKQFQPFQSYSFNKECARPIVFDENFWLD